MKSVIGLVLFTLVGCTSSYRMSKVPDENLIGIAENKEEYELVVLDPGFDTWFVTAWSPAKDRGLEYYSLWNQRYVTEWNFKATRPHTSELFDNVIQYDPAIDYGIEVERKLYYYFRWVDTKLGIPILETRPPGGIL
ncbi:MAG: DUF6146 family protein [Cytophagales bacterium]|nr:DUF6146 family protein [Cytophagales bacterium]